MRKVLLLSLLSVLTLFFTSCAYTSNDSDTSYRKNAYYSGYKDKITYLHTKGNKILDEYDKEIRIQGINWFGLETNTFGPHGLSLRNYKDIIRQISDLGFNFIRIPYSNQMFDEGVMPTGIDYKLNPELEGLKPIEVLDKIIEETGKYNMRVILDRHRPDSSGQSGLWYTDKYPESRWIDDWVMLAERYQGNPTVAAFDLHNEPHGKASWGDGNLETDWHLAAERAGNTILKVNPKLLIIVEGVEKNVKESNDYYWWGGNLEGVRKYPVALDVKNQLVYSAHDYGEGVHDQQWFHESNFPANMPEIWDKMWGYIAKDDIAPVLIGEFGGKSVDSESLEGKWQNALVDYISKNRLNWTYWCLNPESGDTGGILDDDWKTLINDKMALLDKIIYHKNK